MAKQAYAGQLAIICVAVLLVLAMLACSTLRSPNDPVPTLRRELITPTATATPIPSNTPTISPVPSATHTPMPTATATSTMPATPTLTDTAVPSSPSQTLTVTPIPPIFG